MEIELIGVPFDGYGRPGNQARAARALRDAGLRSVLEGYQVIDAGDVHLPAGEQGRGSQTSLMNEPALLAMTDRLQERVAAAIASSRFPLVYGGDCSTLIGIFAGIADAFGAEPRIGLLCFDGHEDTMPLDVSEDGEGANAELGLLLGLTGKLMSGPLQERLPALRADELALLGPRDSAWRGQFNVASLGGVGVWVRALDKIAPDPVSAARQAVTHLAQTTVGWWLHVDLDVLDPIELPAQGLPGVEDIPGGLRWDQLTEALVTAVGMGKCVGWSIAIYDPDQDPGGSGAERIVRLVGDVVGALSR